MIREEWLNESVSILRTRLFAPAGFTVPEAIRISVGFPKGARGGGSGSIAQCWPQDASGDGHAEIFVHPFLDDALRVLDVVTHELIHGINFADGNTGHGKAFKDIAVAVGLEGKMTATVAGPELTAKLAEYAKAVGPYPHKALTTEKNGVKKQGTRMLKLGCECGYTVRTTQKWVDVGTPTCPCGGDLLVEGV